MRGKNWRTMREELFTKASPLKAMLSSQDRLAVYTATDNDKADQFLKQMESELAQDGKRIEVIEPVAPREHIYFNPSTCRVERTKLVQPKNKVQRTTPDLTCIDHAQNIPDRALGQLLKESQQDQQRIVLLERPQQKVKGSLLRRFKTKGLLPVLNRIGRPTKKATQEQKKRTPSAERPYLLSEEHQHSDALFIIKKGKPEKGEGLHYLI